MERPQQKTSQLRGWPTYYDEKDGCWRFCDNDEPTQTSWFTRPCGYCGQYGNSNEGKVDPCLGFLPGVTNACCGHGNPEDAYICFQGGLVIRDFYVEEFHQRQMTEEEKKIVMEFDLKLRIFRTMGS